MRIQIIIPFLISILAVIILTACEPPQRIPPDFRSEVQSIYQELLAEYPEAPAVEPGAEPPAGAVEAGWPYSFHRMVYAAWRYKGQLEVDGNFETRMKEGNDIFWVLNEEIASQRETGATTLDEARFLGLIESETYRQKTEEFMRQGISAIHSFAKAFMADDVADTESTASENILRLLGKLYAEKPELCEVNSSEDETNPDVRWRNWLQIALAVSGPGKVIEWDNEIEGLQDLVPDQPFWEGKLSQAYTLRSIQLAGAAVTEQVLTELEVYRDGGEVSGLHRWMYWNLAYTLETGGGMNPYTDEQTAGIREFLVGGIVMGPLGPGEEAEVVSDALGRAPSVDFAVAVFDLAGDNAAECERRKLAYISLSKMFIAPIDTWIPDLVTLEDLRGRLVNLLATSSLGCGNTAVLDLYGVGMDKFSPLYATIDGAEFSDDEMVNLHNAFIGLMPELVTADERWSAIDLLLWGMAQPEFMMNHPELAYYRDNFLTIYDDWSVTTTFEDSEVTEDDFVRVMLLFRNTLGSSEVQWEE